MVECETDQLNLRGRFAEMSHFFSPDIKGEQKGGKI